MTLRVCLLVAPAVLASACHGDHERADGDAGVGVADGSVVPPDAGPEPVPVCGALPQREYVNPVIDLATDGDRLVVANNMGYDPGPYVAIYQRDGACWSLEQRINGDENLGGTVDIAGDTIAVGTSDDGTFGYYEGSVRTYRLADGEWKADDVIGGCTDLFGSEEFGWAVALQGDLLAASTMGGVEDRVYVYRRGPSGFALEAVLQPSDGEASLYGWEVAIGGDRIFVSAAGRWSDSDVRGAGAVYVYRYDPSRPSSPAPTCNTPRQGKWVEEAILESPSPQIDDWFASGLAVDATGSLLLAGNTQHGEEDDGGGRTPNGAGEVYVFARGPEGWELRHTLTGSGTEDGDDFGASVALGGPDPASPSFAVVGAPYVGPGDGSLDWPPGAAYVFTADGETWTEGARLDSPAAPDAQGAGDRVAATADQAFVTQISPSAVNIHDLGE